MEGETTDGPSVPKPEDTADDDATAVRMLMCSTPAYYTKQSRQE